MKTSTIFKLFFIAVPIFLFFCVSCKKSQLRKVNEQKGLYIGNNHYQAYYTTWDFTYDSITLEPNFFEKIYTNHEIDTVYADTATVNFFNDSISIIFKNGFFQFPVDESNQYSVSYPGYTSYDFTISTDTLFSNYYFTIDRLGDRPGNGSKNSILLKQD